jgi:2-iminobutanoate/2-iminopropanoate deaminase
MKTVNTPKAPAALGPYSQAIVTGNMIFTSGQLGINPESGVLEENIAGQAKRCLNNIQEVLSTAGFEKTNVVKTTIFLKNLEDFDTVNKIYSDFFGDHKPARTTVEVAALPKNALIEVDVVGVK